VEKTDWVKLINKMVLWQWAVITAGVVMGVGVWIITSKHLPPQVPLFYSRPWGEEQLADTRFLWLPLLIAGVVATIVTLAVKKFNLDRVLAVILTGAAMITEIILILAVLRTVILVG
jgi:hypothetical protein